MKRIFICAALSLTAAASQAGQRGANWESQMIGAPPSQPLASPGYFQSGNECGVDRAEAAWDRNYKFLGYVCVRNPSTR